jgi:hypothetical protein
MDDYFTALLNRSDQTVTVAPYNPAWIAERQRMEAAGSCDVVASMDSRAASLQGWTMRQDDIASPRPLTLGERMAVRGLSIEGGQAVDGKDGR